MKRRFLAFVVFYSLMVHCFAQTKIADIKPGDKGSYRFRETFDVLKEDQNIKEGPYAMWYEGVKIVSGNFAHNKKNGLWRYTNVDGVIFYQGNYTDDKKNGCWKYYKNQKPLAVVYFKDDKPDSLWQSFYEDGKIQSKVHFSNNSKNGPDQVFYENGNPCIDASYVNDTIVGTEKTFYKDGTVRSVIEYKKGNAYNVIALNDSTGKPLDPGTLKDGNGILKHYDSKARLFSEVEYKDGLRNGTTTCYDEDGKLFNVNMYINDQLSGKQQAYYKGKLTMEESSSNGFLSGPRLIYDINGKSTKATDYKPEDSVRATENNTYPPFYASQTMPYAQANDAGLWRFIQYNITYPQVEKETGVSGTCYVTFVAEKDGSITNVKLIRGISGGPGCDKEALRIINIIPQWTPGFHNGLPVSVQFNLPIKFTLR